MATKVVDLELSSERTEFSNSSREDVAYAKTFWQSVQLLPPMESRLVSSDIKQRLKVAPPGSQPINVTYPQLDTPDKLQAFLHRAQVEQKAEEVRRLERLSALRRDDIALLDRHRSSRKQREAISASVRSDPQDLDTEAAKCDAELEAINVAEETLQELDEFDQKINGGQVEDIDSD